MSNATDRRDAQMDRVEDACPEEIKATLFDAIYTTALHEEELTSDDVVARCGKPYREMRVLGPLMRRAASTGWIEPTDRYRQSEDPECNARPKRVWRSLIHTPDAELLELL